MVDKQELQNKIESLAEQLYELKEQINSIKIAETGNNIRQIPKEDETYYFLDSDGTICSDIWVETVDDLFRFSVGNCFRTRKEAVDYKDNLITKQQLKDLAVELNNGVNIDWDNLHCNYVYYIMYDCSNKKLTQVETGWYRDLGQAYCLDKKFLEKAKQRIDEDKLIKLIKSGV